MCDIGKIGVKVRKTANFKTLLLDSNDEFIRHLIAGMSSDSVGNCFKLVPRSIFQTKCDHVDVY